MAAIITDVGLTKLATASPLAPLQITHVAFGDNNGVWPKLLDASATSLTNEVYRSTSSDPIKTTAEPQILIFEGSIPGDVGGFTLREMAIFDVDGDMIAIGDIDRIIKPAPGAGNQIILTQRLHVKFSNTSDVELIAQDVAILDHQGLSNRTSSSAHPASSIDVDELLNANLPANDLQTILNAFGTAAKFDAGTALLELPTNSQLNNRLNTTGNLGSAALLDTGTGAGELPTNGDLGSAAQLDTGTGTGELPTNGDLDTRFGEGSNVMVGAVVGFAMTSAPNGWIKANGAAISRTTYAQLFAKIGTTFGSGDGSTTFNVPDLRGEFIRMWDDGRGIDTGRVFGSFQADEFKSHTHDINHYLESDNTGSNISGANGTADQTWVTEATGGTETRPRNIALAAFIKY